jgi:hypothetical protein
MQGRDKSRPSRQKFNIRLIIPPILSGYPECIWQFGNILPWIESLHHQSLGYNPTIDLLLLKYG